MIKLLNEHSQKLSELDKWTDTTNTYNSTYI